MAAEKTVRMKIDTVVSNLITFLQYQGLERFDLLKPLNSLIMNALPYASS